jgi:outer membrane receptor for ferrienterochelin and colicins
MKKKTFLLISLLFFSLAAFSQTDTTKTKDFAELSLEELLNVEVITASGSPQKIFEAPSTILVITKEQIEERGYEELDDALRDVPGIDLINTNGIVPVLKTFRGMYGDDNRRLLIMVDGIVTNPLNGFFSSAGPSFSLHNAERIEIIWGPGSALYGANAYSGVINIITKKGADMNGFAYQHGYGSYNTLFDKVMLGVKKPNFDIVLSGSLYNTDGPRFANRHPNYNNSYVDNAWSFNGSIEHAYKKFKTKLGAWAFDAPSGTGTNINSPTQLYGLPSQGHEVTGSVGQLCADLGGEKASLWNPYTRAVYLQNEFAPNNKFSITTRLLYRETGLSQKSHAYLDLDTANGNNLATKTWYSFHNNRVEGEISAKYILKENNKFYAGLKFFQDNLETGYRDLIPDSRIHTIDLISVSNLFPTFKDRVFTIQNNIGAYAQYELSTTFLHKTNLTIGSRYDNNNVYGTTINPRIGIINQPNEKLTFKFLFGTAFRSPSVFELYSLALTRIANPALKSEKIYTYDVNIIYTPAKSFLLQISLYQNNLNDLIVSDVVVTPGVTQNRNVGSASTRGLEAKADIILSKNFSSFLNFTWQEGTTNDGTKQINMPNIAKTKGNAGVTVHIADLFTISIIENIVGRRSVFSTNPLGEVKGYFITNIVLSTRKLFNDRVSASINIRNLTNQTYFDPGWRPKTDLSGTVHDQRGINE